MTLEDFEQHISDAFPYLKGQQLLVACSGGIDSVVLAHILDSLEYDIALAHCNFQLRGGESDEDERFVSGLADKLEVAFFAKKFDTEHHAKLHKLSIQVAARELRYEWFEQLRQTMEYDYVLTAHHADDDLETFLINLSRGSGLRGLTGIPQFSDRAIRPLLDFSKQQLFDYAKSQQLYWREDSSNAKTEYLRNQIRQDVVPPYKNVVPHLLANFIKSRDYLSGSQQLVGDYVDLVTKLVMTQKGADYAIAIDKLEDLPHSSLLLYELLQPFGFTAWQDVYQLVDAQSGKQLFSKTHRLLKDRSQLLVSPIPDDEPQEQLLIAEQTQELFAPIELHFEPCDRFQITNANTVFVDTDLLKYPLLLRKWKEGDYIQPFGMQGKKKLSKLFKDEKLSLMAKEKMWVLCSDQTVFWVVGLKLDDRYKVTKDTKNILKITYLPNE